MDFGLQNNVVYNVPGFNTDSEDTVVDMRAVIFDVDCGSIPDLRQSGDAFTTLVNGSETLTIPVHIDDRLHDVNISAGMFAAI